MKRSKTKAAQLLNVWMLSREYGEIAGAGGVKDVVRQLAEALAIIPGTEVRVVLPLYGFIRPSEHGFVPLKDPLDPSRQLEFAVDMNYSLEERQERCRIWSMCSAGVTIYLVEADRFREKMGIYTYSTLDRDLPDWQRPGMGHYDYFAMNVLLQKSSIELMLLLGEKPDVIHCHDGHTALVPTFINECQGWRNSFRETGCLVTIHNAGMGYHQEIGDAPFAHAVTGLSWKTIGENRLTGQFDPFLAASHYAVMNAVSENYARELQETDGDRITDWLGHSLLARGVRLEGVTNGICPELFDPSLGEKIGLPAAYDPADGQDRLAGKLVCKEHLLALVNAQRALAGVESYGELAGASDEPLFVFIGRLSEQKGVDYFLSAIEDLFSSHGHGQAVILGSGSEFFESAVRSLVFSDTLKGRLCFLRGFSSELANLVYAAGDFFVIPSRYEPCGLTDYIAQLFGTVPVVHHVGGLVKVEDGETGIAYGGDSAEALRGALDRAFLLYADKDRLRSMQRQAVETIRKKYTWDVVKQQYLLLYDKAKARRIDGLAT
ncbi:MAG: glycogen synthase [Desulfopila sp.]